MNKHVEEYLDFYIKIEKPEYAVLLNGAWGCGKTHFIDNYINTHQSKKFIKISLFGLKELSDIDEMIFYQLYPIFDHKLVKITGGFLKTAVKLGFRVDLDGDGKSETTATPNFEKINILDAFKKNKNLDNDFIFVFDDLERTEINMSIILGYINYLTEQSGFKVIIIANKDEITEENKAVFERFNEKIIGNTFEIQNDFNSVLDDFLENGNELLSANKSIIMEVNDSCENNNLRVVKQVIDDFEFLIEKIKPKYLENKEFIERLIRQFFFLSTDFKKNKKIDESFEKMRSEKYMYTLFSSDIWKEVLESRTIKTEQLNSLIGGLYFFIEEFKKEKPTWFQLLNYSLLEENEFNELLDIMIDDFKNYRYHNEEVFLHVVGLLINFIDKKITNFTLNEVQAIVRETIKKEIIEIKETSATDIEFCAFGRAYQSSDNKDFQDIQHKVNTYNNQLLERKGSQVITSYENQIIEDIKTNTCKVTYEILVGKNRQIPLFNHFKTHKIIESLNQANNKSLFFFNMVINARYSDKHSFEGKPYCFYLKDELVFWQEFKVQLENLINITKSELVIKKDNLNSLLTETQYIIEKLQK